jgi:glycosyltransferase involved in cell wall biosynthesis
MKQIAYVSLIMSYQSGVAAKMRRNAETAKKENIPIDYYWLTSSFQTGKKDIDSINVMISKHSNPILMRIWQARELNRLAKRYDALVIRYPLYDPFLHLMLRSRNKIITEHHTKELSELRLLRSWRRFMERSCGNRWLNKFAGVIGVTEEIVQYEKERSGFRKKSIFIPNTIPVDLEAPLTGAIGLGEKINIIFVANFRPWHGLPKVIEGLEKAGTDGEKICLHLVGKIPDEEHAILEGFKNVVMHGELPNERINEMYADMDFAIGGFNLHVKDMQEATSLKVREYLAYGLPTLIGSRDPAFPKGFGYLVEKDEFDIGLIAEYIEKHRGLEKSIVRKEAEPYINSKYALKKMFNFSSESV